MKMKNITAIFLAFSIICTLAGCGGKKEATEETPEITNDITEEKQEMYYNELTGLNELESNLDSQRALAVMISNYKKSTPQWGISKADVFVEMPVEGGITRFMAIFKDWTGLEKVGPVRSARDYFISVALGFNAIYGHFGGSPMAYAKLQNERIEYIDGIRSGQYFKRDAERRKNAGLEHSAYSTGDMLKKGIESKKISTVNSKDNIMFEFNDSDTAEGEDTSYVKIPYSGYISPYYQYDSDKKVYKRFQFDKEHIDGNNNEQIAVKNILILYTKVSEINGDEKGRLDVKTIGSGNGVYISNGKRQNIIWKKSGDKSQIELLKEDGTELKINRGKTWINYVSKYYDKKITFNA